MQAMASGKVCLYAVVPSEQAHAARSAALRGLRLVESGPVVAVVGKPGQELERAALRHDRVISQALESCSAVVPFRLGIVLESREELQGVLESNQDLLVRYLKRFRGCVEMGLKAKLPAQVAGEPLRMPFSLERIRTLAHHAEDRRERMRPGAAGPIFEGCYLISRRDIDTFWLALEELQQSFPELPLLGSGPWAPYSFCDFALQPSQKGSSVFHGS
jgi:hypothetical protein